jgi:sugar phosphate isomerase/epimerase
MKIRRNISISTGFDYDIPIEKQVPLIAQAGFTHISLGTERSHFDYLSKEARRKFTELLGRYSLKIDTIHGPDAIKTDVEEFKAIAEASVELGVPVVVFHAGLFEFPESELDSMFLELKKICRDLDIISQNTGVTFALENVAPGPATELVRKLLLETDFTHIGFCYDSAHDQIDGPRPFDLLKQLKHKLVAVHPVGRLYSLG